MDRARLLISDLDGTLLGDDDALERFSAWVDLHDHVTVAYATGRSFASVRRLVETTQLPRPHLVAANVGTEVRDFASGREFETWRLRSIQSFDPATIRAVLTDLKGVSLQRDEFQTSRKVSFHYPMATACALDAIVKKLQASGQEADVIYSSERDLDVLPRGVHKGSAARFIATLYGIDDEHVVVAGDTGNDLLLMEEGFRGVVVANAQPELREVDSRLVHHAHASFADGVLEGIRHWTQETVGA